MAKYTATSLFFSIFYFFLSAGHRSPAVRELSKLGAQCMADNPDHRPIASIPSTVKSPNSIGPVDGGVSSDGLLRNCIYVESNLDIKTFRKNNLL